MLFSKGDELGRRLGLEVLEFHFPHGESWSLERVTSGLTKGAAAPDG
jgi:hypothetical protein